MRETCPSPKMRDKMGNEVEKKAKKKKRSKVPRCQVQSPTGVDAIKWTWMERQTGSIAKRVQNKGSICLAFCSLWSWSGASTGWGLESTRDDGLASMDY